MERAIFYDRHDAGRRLAAKLGEFVGQPNLLVLALPRGGVPVGYEVARALHAPFDLFLVRKLGVPGQEELAMGAIASGGVRVINRQLIQSLGIPPSVIDAVAEEEQRELERREQRYREGWPLHDLRGKTVILVDDGLATGATMAAAVTGVYTLGAARVVVAVPIAAPEICEAFETLADRVVCADTPSPFWGVGMWYTDFSQTSDEEVRDLLARAAEAQGEWR